MPYIGRAPTSTATKLEDADQDTKIQVEESSDEDTIRFDIAGSEDFTMTANTFTALSGSTIATNTIAETTGASGVTIDGLLIKDSTAAFADGAVATPSITNTGDTNTGIYFPAADTVGVVTGGTEQFRFGSNPIPGGTKNLFHNGDFAVAQRGTSATGIGAGAAGYKVFDGVINTGLTGDETGRYTMSQSATAPANTGHRQSMKVDITTADTSIAAGHWYYLEMRLEAQNVSHLLYGESGAKPLTVSFWTRSTTTGDYQFLLSQPDGGRAYSTGYTISSADTWEKKTLTIPGDTGGTINNDTGIGLILTFMLTGSSSSQGGTEDSWASVANNMYGAGQTLNLFSSTDNDWYMAGLQVEVGSVATDFAFEDLGTTLQKCQRYYLDWTATVAHEVYTTGQADNTTDLISQFQYPTTMRVAPTFSASDGTFWVLAGKGTAINTTAVSGGRLTKNGCYLVFVVSSGLTAGEAWNAQRDGTDAAFLTWSAEL